MFKVLAMSAVIFSSGMMCAAMDKDKQDKDMKAKIETVTEGGFRLHNRGGSWETTEFGILPHTLGFLHANFIGGVDWRPSAAQIPALLTKGNEPTKELTAAVMELQSEAKKNQEYDFLAPVSIFLNEGSRSHFFEKVKFLNLYANIPQKSTALPAAQRNKYCLCGCLN